MAYVVTASLVLVAAGVCEYGLVIAAVPVDIVGFLWLLGSTPAERAVSDPIVGGILLGVLFVALLVPFHAAWLGHWVSLVPAPLAHCSLTGALPSRGRSFTDRFA